MSFIVDFDKITITKKKTWRRKSKWANEKFIERVLRSTEKRFYGGKYYAFVGRAGRIFIPIKRIQCKF